MAGSLDFDATNKKKETKHFRIDLKNVEKLSANCNTHFCWVAGESGKAYTIHDKEAVEYNLYFGWDPYGPDIVRLRRMPMTAPNPLLGLPRPSIVCTHSPSRIRTVRATSINKPRSGVP
jgi:hypothetical protein